MSTIRIQKIIADSGLCSRRAAEQLIIQGDVKLNGQVATIGQSADPFKDKIHVHGKLVKVAKERVYALFNKPKGLMTTLADPYEQYTIQDYIPPHLEKYRLFPVGRLDKDAEGLLILTNDGEFGNKIMHPRYKCPKTYRVWLDKAISRRDIEFLQQGVQLSDCFVKDVRVRSLSHTTAEITIKVGRHKVVKRIFAAAGYRVKRLVRLKIGKLELGTLKSGNVQIIKEENIKKLVGNI